MRPASAGMAFAEALPRAVRHMEGPVPHGGCVALMLLCDQIRKVSKVVLTGEGADEMFGGYLRYAEWRKLAWQERIGKMLPGRLLPPVRPFLGLRKHAGFDPAVYSSIFHDYPKIHALFPGLIPKPGAREKAGAGFTDFRDRLFASDQIGYLESLLVRQDKMSMPPPSRRGCHLYICRWRGSQMPCRATSASPVASPKPLLKCIAEKFLDRDVIHRRKIGLLLPYDEWLKRRMGLAATLTISRRQIAACALTRNRVRSARLWHRSVQAAARGFPRSDPGQCRNVAAIAGRAGNRAIEIATSANCVTTVPTFLKSASACEVVVDEAFGWRRFRSGDLTLWLKGWMDGLDGAGLARRLARSFATLNAKAVGAMLRDVNGHYAVVATGPDSTLAAVDRVRSIPLAAAKVGGAWVIDDQPERLRQRAGLGWQDHDADAVLSLAMAGYTVDDAALYRGIELLGPGEVMRIASGKRTRHRYYTYRPWRVQEADPQALEKKLAETTLAIIERTLASLDGRPLIVPLSAGCDSRLIVSAARHLGFDNLSCFTYGRAGNFEAEASRTIAEKLGYPWTFVPATIASQRRFFTSDAYAGYLDYADSGASVPFVQDMAALKTLKKQGFVPDDAVIANGNSGDYITGGHIVSELQESAAGHNDEWRWKRIVDALTEKHLTLWRVLATPANKARIAALLRKSSPAPAANRRSETITGSMNMPSSRTGNVNM